MDSSFPPKQKSLSLESKRKIIWRRAPELVSNKCDLVS
jgi:hypothetical protein